MSSQISYSNHRKELVEVILFLSNRGWSPGTGGNYSVVVSTSPLLLLMSPSGVDKGRIQTEDLIVVDEQGKVVEGSGKASAETAIHIVLAKKYGAKSTLHTHSIWNTVHSLSIKPFQSMKLEGYEMLKALGEKTHETSIQIPVFPNTQDIDIFADALDDEHETYQDMKGFLMAGHGLYSWGDSIYSAKRHIEALEFLFEIEGTLLRRK